MKLIYESPLTDSTLGWMMTQFKPSVRTISIYRVRYRISFPYTIFGMRPRRNGDLYCGGFNLSFYVAKKPYQLNDELFWFPLPNTAHSGDVGDCGFHYTSRNKVDVFREAIAAFWNSEFSYLVYSSRDKMPISVVHRSIEDSRRLGQYWQNLSEENPLYWENYNFSPIYLRGSPHFPLQKKYWKGD